MMVNLVQLKELQAVQGGSIMNKKQAITKIKHHIDAQHPSQVKELQMVQGIVMPNPSLPQKVKEMREKREKRDKEKQLIKDALRYYCEKVEEETQYQLGFNDGFDAGEDNVRVLIDVESRETEKARQAIKNLDQKIKDFKSLVITGAIFSRSDIKKVITEFDELITNIKELVIPIEEI